MRLVVTGAEGFIGKNLLVRLATLSDCDVFAATRATSPQQLKAAIGKADAIIHLAGENRPKAVEDFAIGNAALTQAICTFASQADKPPTILFASTIRAVDQTPYGQSKRLAEEHLLSYGQSTGACAKIFRLPNVFGKWSQPNYNSAVATFCHNIARTLPITIHDPGADLQLVYIDDVVDAFLETVGKTESNNGFIDIAPVYRTTVGALAATIESFHAARGQRHIPETGGGFVRALHATYLSFLPKEDFSYPITSHSDPRGSFAEIVKTQSSGQVSFFTINPGQVRGGHYHHSKTEKFLIVRGKARFGFRHVVTGEQYTIDTSGDALRVVETVPGWAHNVANIGDDEAVCFLWANEIFDPMKPDTYSHAV
jgi:UDP-2-acetamido-2,6-beta-L-arabino-hexul-4-ose reductase